MELMRLHEGLNLDIPQLRDSRAKLGGEGKGKGKL
jgi:hypothetical protein